MYIRHCCSYVRSSLNIKFIGFNHDTQGVPPFLPDGTKVDKCISCSSRNVTTTKTIRSSLCELKYKRNSKIHSLRKREDIFIGAEKGGDPFLANWKRRTFSSILELWPWIHIPLRICLDNTTWSFNIPTVGAWQLDVRYVYRLDYSSAKGPLTEDS